MELIEGENAPGPLVPESELLPPLSYEGKLEYQDLVGKQVPILHQAVGWCSLVLIFTLTMKYASLLQALGVFSLGIVGGWFWLMRDAPEIDETLRVAEIQALRAEVGEFQFLIAELEQQMAEAESGYARFIALNDLGYYELRDGNYKRALVCLSEAYRWVVREKSDASNLIENTRNSLSVAYLLSDDLLSADVWALPTKGPTLYISKKLSLARAGKYREVLEQGDFPRIRPKYQTILAHTARVFALMQAFSRSKLGQENSKAEFDAARPVSSWDYSYLCTNWPELAEFVATLPILERESSIAIPKARVLMGGDSD